MFLIGNGVSEPVINVHVEDDSRLLQVDLWRMQIIIPEGSVLLSVDIFLLELLFLRFLLKLVSIERVLRLLVPVSRCGGMAGGSRDLEIILNRLRV